MWLDNDMTTNLRQQPNSNWIIGTVDGLTVQAKCYSEPSQYGLELDGRISKLWVSIPARDGRPPVCLFNYDRGHDVNDLEQESLQTIVAAVGAAIK